jgi:hypothetical protein
VAFLSVVVTGAVSAIPCKVVSLSPCSLVASSATSVELVSAFVNVVKDYRFSTVRVACKVGDPSGSLVG